MQEQVKMQNPAQVSNDLLDFIKNRYTEDFNIETLRLGLGLTIASIHATLIHSAKTKEAQHEAVGTAMDTVQRMVGSIQRDCVTCGIEGVEFTEGTIDDDGNFVEVKQGETHEGGVH